MMCYISHGLPGCELFVVIISLTIKFSEKKNVLKMKCVYQFSPQILYETFLIPRIIQGDIITSYLGLQVKGLFIFL